MGKRKRHTPDEVIRKLQDADLHLAQGKPVAEVAKVLGVSEQTFARWRSQYGGMKASEGKRLRELEDENRRQEAGGRPGLDIDMLKEIAKGNF